LAGLREDLRKGFDAELAEIIESFGLSSTSMGQIEGGSPRPPRPNPLLTPFYQEDDKTTYNHPSIHNFKEFFVIQGNRISTSFLKLLMVKHNSSLVFFNNQEYKYIRTLVKQKGFLSLHQTTCALTTS